MKPAYEKVSMFKRFPDGRIDYTGENYSLGLYCAVLHEDSILLVKRSEKVDSMKNQWHVIAGYIDDESQTVQDKVREELTEEIGVEESDIEKITVFNTITINHNSHEACIYGAIARIKHDNIALDWEHSEYKWVPLPELTEAIDNLPCTPNLRRFLEYIGLVVNTSS